MFSAEAQQQIRVQLGGSLIGVISQTLCKTLEGKRALAAEILVNNNAVGNLVRKQNIADIFTNPNWSKIRNANT